MKFFAFLLVLAIFLKAGLAVAGPAEDCNQKENMDLRIQGCTQVIEQEGWNSEDRATALTLRGIAHRVRRDFATAIADFDEAVRLNPQYAYAFSNRAYAHWAQGDLIRAIADFGDAIRLNPQDAEFFYSRGAIHQAQDLARAVADYDEAIRLNPQYARAFNARCWARALSEGDLAVARADCDSAVAISKSDSEYLKTRGVVGLKQSLFAEAWGDFDAALRAVPEDAIALYGRGFAALRLGRTAEGNADQAEATKLDANVAQTYAEGYGVTP